MVVELVLGLVLMLSLLVIFPRIMSRGKILCYFARNRQEISKFLKEDVENNCVWIGKDGSEDREKYMIDNEKIFTVQYPGGFPSILQVPVRALRFVRDVSEPYDPEKHSSKYSAKYLRLVTDVNMLKSQWKDVRDALKLVTGKTKMQELIVPIGIGIILIITLMGTYLTMQNGKTLKDIKNAVEVNTVITTQEGK